MWEMGWKERNGLVRMVKVQIIILVNHEIAWLAFQEVPLLVGSTAIQLGMRDFRVFDFNCLLLENVAAVAWGAEGELSVDDIDSFCD